MHVGKGDNKTNRNNERIKKLRKMIVTKKSNIEAMFIGAMVIKQTGRTLARIMVKH